MKNKKAVYLTVIVSALGYFVDIYDLLLFGIVRMASLRDLGVPETEMLQVGVRLINMQMAGLLLGGIFWGVLGDKKGRKSVLFGSILMYSLANIANAFVTNTEMYAWLRLVAGIGLAGELGAAITLVSEVMPKETRGYGTSIVAGVGILGAVFASIIGDAFNWKIAYLVGGGLGLGLLVLRAGLLESSMFNLVKKDEKIPRGNFFKLFTSWVMFKKYLACILIGVPIWYVIGILITFSPEITRATGVQGLVTASKSIMWTYVGLSVGDLASGLLSQYLKSRKKALGIFIGITAAFVVVYVLGKNLEVFWFYVLCVCLGFGAGYWAMFVTVAAEQFGTNIRATVTTSAPNFVRGSLIPLTLMFEFFRLRMGTLNSVIFVGAICFALAILALTQLKETFGKDLDCLERL